MTLARAILLLSLAFPSWANVSFNRDVRPLIALNCIDCHGPAKAKGDLRLDGMSAVDSRELARRLRSSDPDEVMPPPDSGKKLAPADVAILGAWADQGAKFEKHWAFDRIERPTIPNEDASNPIDAFTKPRGKSVSDQILRRRLAFDLLGLPPRPGDAALAFDELVESYLAAPQFGERMAVWWLNLVRYADTEGYFADLSRNIYPYRDYVIRSFNQNKSFAEFTMEQLAGDLIESAGLEGKIASGYNRLIMTTQEDGANAADYRARYAADRVKNLGTVWMGLTLGCAQCHDHKSDPVSAADFYRTAAFFADVKEEAVLKQEEVVVVAQTQEYRDLLEQTDALKRLLAALEPETRCAQILAEEEMRATRRPLPYWPRSKKTDAVLSLVLKGERSSAEDATVAAYFRRHFITKLNGELMQVTKAREKFETGQPKTLVTDKGPVRTVRILPRGNWLDDSGAMVEPGFLGFLDQSPNIDRRYDRSDLARWLMSRDNPLTSRVLANRLWALFFTEGLAPNLDDFGTQSPMPPRGDLLDWLAIELLENGWNIKALVRLMVTSKLYQGVQAPSLLDPEFLRDNTLTVAGLLSGCGGGEPVTSYLPDSYLRSGDPAFEEESTPDSGERLYRRGVYLHRRRASIYPIFGALNASSRQECVSEHVRTRTPHEALALLNSPQFIEASRAFAERIYKAAPSDRQRLSAGVRMALGREPSEKELTILANLLNEQRNGFESAVSAAQFIRTGNYRWPKNISAKELAAWTNVARVLLNLEETHTRY